MPGSPQTVHDLRRQWKPHKERLATVRSEHPTAIRFHRVCSWLSEVEKLDPVRHADQISGVPLAISGQAKRCKQRGQSGRRTTFMSGGWQIDE